MSQETEKCICGDSLDPVLNYCRTCDKFYPRAAVRPATPEVPPQRCMICALPPEHSQHSDKSDEYFHAYQPPAPAVPDAILLKKQIDAEQAWEFLLSKGVPNLDIERPGKDKVTLVELLAEYANGVLIGRKTMSYDQKCYDLAVQFLEDHPHINVEPNRQELAQIIQDAIEEYIKS